MTASVGFLSILVGTALAIAIVSPIVLIALLIRDWIKDKPW